MSRIHAKRRAGFILAEALIALVILGMVFLALEGSLAMALRSLAESDREGVAARTAETQRERAFAGPCRSASGSDSVNGVVVDWSASGAGSLVHVTQSSRYPRRIGDRVERYDAIGPCR